MQKIYTQKYFNIGVLFDSLQHIGFKPIQDEQILYYWYLNHGSKQIIVRVFTKEAQIEVRNGSPLTDDFWENLNIPVQHPAGYEEPINFDLSEDQWCISLLHKVNSIISVEDFKSNDQS